MPGKIIKNIYRGINIYQSDIEYDMVVYVGNKFFCISIPEFRY